MIARTERLIAWWTPPQKRPMFFGTTQGDMAGINGAIFPQPALVWLAMDHSLSIRAFKENRRPAADTKLCVAPYWNVYETGERLPWIDAGSRCLHRRLHSPMGTELL